MEQEIKNLPAGRQGNLPRDLFLHLLAIVSLYWSAISFTVLLWQYVNYFFPDNLSYFNFSGFEGLIRFSVASLIIVFPIFILVSWYLNTLYGREAQVRESKIRKWLIYLTLFIAALVIIGDLVSIINNLLGGATTVQFILKTLAILLVAALVFGYYLDDVRKEIPSKLGKYFAWLATILVVAAIIGAFFIIGSPNSARLAQYDQQRLSDLQTIQSQIVNYWQKKGALPAALGDLNDSISGFAVPVDPQTKIAYEYDVKDATALSFELCAQFSQPNKNPTVMQPMADGDEYSETWDHPAGHFCFERTIDKQLYPPITVPK